jgi:iron complex transport system substrate-binding protein
MSGILAACPIPARPRTKLLLLLTILLCRHSLASRVVTDETGRKVLVPDHPHRIVCLAPSVTDAVYALGAGQDVIAISDYTHYPPEALKKPSVGSTLTPSVETILALKPDLVLGIHTPGQLQSADAITRLGVPIYFVDPQGISGILRSVTDFGQVLNRQPQAAQLVHSLEARIEAVRTRVQGKAPTRVFMPLWYDPIITIGRHAFITELIADAGGRSITDDLAQDWPQVSMEAVIARAPDNLLLVRDGKLTLDLLQNKPGWSTLAAVRERRTFFVDDSIDLPSPIAIQALEELARQFHP